MIPLPLSLSSSILTLFVLDLTTIHYRTTHMVVYYFFCITGSNWTESSLPRTGTVVSA